MEGAADHITANQRPNAPNGFLEGRVLVQELAALVIFDDFAVAVDMQMVSRQCTTRLCGLRDACASQQPTPGRGYSETTVNPSGRSPPPDVS
jgi:hypothetical protein